MRGDRAQGIEAKNLVKRFGDTDAVNGISLSVAPGEIVSLLGPNGAGKSTLLRMLSTMLLPDEGSVTICGTDAVAHPRQARKSLSMVSGDERSFYWRLSGYENLRFFCALHGIARKHAEVIIDDVLKTVELTSASRQRVDTYSTGMRARLGLARGLLSSPKVFLLDEPTRSLDPMVAIEIRGLVRRLAESGVALLVATHDLHEAAAISDRVLIQAQGSIQRELERPFSAESLEQHFLESVPA